jgi:hypothetical protein
MAAFYDKQKVDIFVWSLGPAGIICLSSMDRSIWVYDRGPIRWAIVRLVETTRSIGPFNLGHWCTSQQPLKFSLMRQSTRTSTCCMELLIGSTSHALLMTWWFSNQSCSGSAVCWIGRASSVVVAFSTCSLWDLIHFSITFTLHSNARWVGER